MNAYDVVGPRTHQGENARFATVQHRLVFNKTNGIQNKLLMLNLRIKNKPVNILFTINSGISFLYNRYMHVEQTRSFGGRKQMVPILNIPIMHFGLLYCVFI